MTGEIYSRHLGYRAEQSVRILVTQEANGFAVFFFDWQFHFLQWFFDRDRAIEYAVKLNPRQDDRVGSLLSTSVIRLPNY